MRSASLIECKVPVEVTDGKAMTVSVSRTILVLRRNGAFLPCIEYCGKNSIKGMRWRPAKSFA